MLNKTMLSKAMLADETVSIYFDMMIWLSSQYGPASKQAVPKVINPETPIDERCWGDEDCRTVFAWAEAEVTHLAKVCDMENWSVQVAPDGHKAKLQAANSVTITPLKSSAWQAGEYPGYFVDCFGRPVFFYDPRQCVEPGYFVKTLIPQFALLKIYAKHPPLEFDERLEFGESSIKSLVQMTTCHMGLGFTMLALAQANIAESWLPISFLAQADNDRDDPRPYLYGTLLSLTAHRLTPEQIIATYGPLMSQHTRKNLRPALSQIESQTDLLKLLRLVSRHKLREAPSPERETANPYAQLTSAT